VVKMLVSASSRSRESAKYLTPRTFRVIAMTAAKMCLRLFSSILPLTVAISMFYSDSSAFGKGNPEQAQIIRSLRDRGAKISVDDKTPDSPVVSLDFSCAKCAPTDADIRDISRLAELRKLALSLDAGTITDAGLKHLENLKYLQDLTLSGPKVTDNTLKCLKGLSHLRRLSLRNTEVTDAGFEQLTTLAPQIQELRLWDSKITDAGLARIKRLPILQTLYLNLCRSITIAGFQCLAEMKQLQKLDLDGTYLNNERLECLKGLSNLQSLFAGDSSVTDAGLKYLEGLTNLQSLDLRRTKVTDAGLERLKGLGKLRFLNLIETNVTDTGVQMLKKSLPQCRIASGSKL
jgi:hypothetical protein